MSSQINFTSLPIEAVVQIANFDTTNTSYFTIRSLCREYARELSIELYRTTGAIASIFASLASNNDDPSALLWQFLRHVKIEGNRLFWKRLDNTQLEKVAELFSSPVERIYNLAFDTMNGQGKSREAIHKDLDTYAKIISLCKDLRTLCLYTQPVDGVSERFIQAISEKQLTTLQLPHVYLPPSTVKFLMNHMRTLKTAALSMRYEPGIADQLQGKKRFRGVQFEVKVPQGYLADDISALFKKELSCTTKKITIHVHPDSRLYLPAATFIRELPQLALLCQQGVILDGSLDTRVKACIVSYEIALRTLAVKVARKREAVDEVEELCQLIDSLHISTSNRYFNKLFTDERKINDTSSLDQLVLMPKVSCSINPFIELYPLLSAANPRELVMLGYFSSKSSACMGVTVDACGELFVSLADRHLIVQYEPFPLSKLPRLKRLVMNRGDFDCPDKRLKPFIGRCLFEDKTGKVHKCTYLDIQKFKQHLRK